MSQHLELERSDGGIVDPKQIFGDGRELHMAQPHRAKTVIQWAGDDHSFCCQGIQARSLADGLGKRERLLLKSAGKMERSQSTKLPTADPGAAVAPRVPLERH